jgi:hypothetical protein
MATATYDLSNASATIRDRSKVRLYARDTNTSTFMFSDEEWDVFIADAPHNNLYLAAAAGLRMAAADQARTGAWKDAQTNKDAGADKMIELAEWLEQQAVIPAVTESTSYLFGLASPAARRKMPYKNG